MNHNWSDYERYLKPVHLKEQAVTLTIVRVVEEDTHPRGGEIVKAPVLYFRELPFGLILSPTNRQMLATLYGDSVAACIGKTIVVKSTPVKVGRLEKTPIRILNQRPPVGTPRVEPETGEITPSTVGEGQGEGLPAPAVGEGRGEGGQSELDKYLGPNPRTAQPELPAMPVTEAAFTAWLKEHGWSGLETRQALGTDAKSWLKKNPQLTWADVARQVEAHQVAQGK